MMKITKDMKITEIVTKYPETIEVLFQHGLGCVGCAAAQFESLQQGAEAHGLDTDALVVALNKALDNK